MSAESPALNLVDSSGWLEYFADGENASFFAPVIEDIHHLVVPVVCIYEVFKKIMQTHGQAAQSAAEFRAADMMRGQVIDITASLAISAALISAESKMPMADSLILAVARENNALLWTQDGHFEGLQNVRFINK